MPVNVDTGTTMKEVVGIAPEFTSASSTLALHKIAHVPTPLRTVLEAVGIVVILAVEFVQNDGCDQTAPE